MQTSKSNAKLNLPQTMSKSKSIQKNKFPQRSKSKVTLKTMTPQSIKQPYFCHYKNAMYMGESKLFQKNGNGILIHDNGTAAITNYLKDMLDGQNLLFLPNGALASILYVRDRIFQGVYRTKQKLFYAKYKNEIPQGYTIFINFTKKQIIYSKFKNGHVIQKRYQQKQEILKKIFEMQKLDVLIPNNFLKQLNLQFQSLENIQIIKRINKVTIGFAKNGFLNGLGFVLLYKLNGQNLQTLPEYHLQLIQKGYYKNSLLEGLGQKKFKNGNVYIGQFKNDMFQGKGILKNFLKQNWVSGKFEKGNLVQLLKYNNNELEGDDTFIVKLIQSIHRKKSSWVSKDVNILNFNFFEKQIQKIQNFKQNQAQRELKQKKIQILKKIQENFMSENNTSRNQSLSKSPKLMETPSGKYLNKSESDYKLSLKNYQNRQNIRHKNSSFQSKRNQSPNNIQTFRKDDSISQYQQIPQSEPYYIKVLPVPFDNQNGSSQLFQKSASRQNISNEQNIPYQNQQNQKYFLLKKQSQNILSHNRNNNSTNQRSIQNKNYLSKANTQLQLQRNRKIQNILDSIQKRKVMKMKHN